MKASRARTSPRYQARFAATLESTDEPTVVCHTRDISLEGCFLDTEAPLEEASTVELAITDNRTGDEIQISGTVRRAVTGGVGIKLSAPPREWVSVVERYRKRSETDLSLRPDTRLRVLVAATNDKRREALALYVKSGWDVRFAGDVATAVSALEDNQFDVVVVDHDDKLARENVLVAAQKECRDAVRLSRAEARLAHASVKADSLDDLMSAISEHSQKEAP